MTESLTDSILRSKHARHQRSDYRCPLVTTEKSLGVATLLGRNRIPPGCASRLTELLRTNAISDSDSAESCRNSHLLDKIQQWTLLIHVCILWECSISSVLPTIFVLEQSQPQPSSSVLLTYYIIEYGIRNIHNHINDDFDPSNEFH
ncbi:hypothetical protein EVAR_11338_1 [Eumeta japonica]|uniref:Uncharacterized protein n=1 Tax=Eumeta variegata TaxID=151549 RepID=A0A4C1U142_EUMVA|nr:hypothetical protein EVAR_11338_1 [Eumeta japonica]